jgi:Ca2+-binding RTX toxin-like protein
VQVNLGAGTGVGGDAQGDTFDSIESLSGSLFNDILTGNTAANTLTGADGADRLSGGGGADTLKGGVGHDIMTGGGAADKFVFNTAAVSANSDTITDFTHAVDKIQLENSVFTALGAATGTLAAAKFFIGANAHDGDDRIIYDSATGRLYYDDDGNGAHAKVLIATLTAQPSLTISDLLVI